MRDQLTPIRRQYLRIKQDYPDAIVLFRLGDFYETFDDDARLASRELDIVLTFKSMGKNLKVPLAGIPAHSLESYLARLIKKGHRVAICEQLSDPAASKRGGLVERDVVRVVTPGTVMEPSLLDQKANNYLVAVVVDGDEAGLAYADITTGEFSTTQLSPGELVLEVSRLAPSELVAPQGFDLPAGGEYMVTCLPHRRSTMIGPAWPCSSTSGSLPWSPSAAPSCRWPSGLRERSWNIWVRAS